jgi:transposase
MTQLHRGMGGTAPQPTHLRRSYPHQPERRLVGDIAFRVLAADNQPNFRTISDFLKIHLKTLEGLFEQVLKIALEAGALKVGRVALEGTKIKANASTHKAMS